MTSGPSVDEAVAALVAAVKRDERSRIASEEPTQREYTLTAAAKRIGKRDEFVRAEIEAGRLKGFVVDGQFRTTERWIVAWEDACAAEYAASLKARRRLQPVR